MRVPRVYLPGARSGASFQVSAAASHHLARVLRRKPGDPLVVLDGEGGVFEALLESVGPEPGSLRVRVGSPLPALPLPAASLAVALGVPRGDGFEIAVRWASEMGLSRLIPLLTARGVVRLAAGEGSASRSKLERWRRIALESAQQSKRPVPLRVEAPVGLPDLLSAPGARISRWIAVPGGPDLADSGLLQALGAEGEALVLVGPEGGFEPGEIARAEASDFVPVGFPTPVLRAPTVVAYLGALASLTGWLREGPPQANTGKA